MKGLPLAEALSAAYAELRRNVALSALYIDEVPAGGFRVAQGCSCLSTTRVSLHGTVTLRAIGPLVRVG